jgi:hypothetical protein
MGNSRIFGTYLFNENFKINPMQFSFQNEAHYVNFFRKIWTNKGWAIDDFHLIDESIALIYQISQYDEFCEFQKKANAKDILNSCTSFVKFNNIDSNTAMNFVKNITEDCFSIFQSVYKNKSIAKTRESIILFVNNNHLDTYKNICLNLAYELNNMPEIGSNCFEFLIKLNEKGVFGLYFLYNEKNDLVYVGKSISLMSRLLSQIKNYKPAYFKIAYPSSVSDMHVYEMYYISKFKPCLNIDAKNNDKLTIELPELMFSNPVNIRD